ncbi:MAG: ketoacyl-ACP synthase III [Acidobacteria bacterium]|nr:ketoacyl-ACP synthase III [Acidobacteriota bacterium]
MELTEQGEDRFLRNLQAFPEPRSRIAGLGVSLPGRVVTNEDVADSVEAPPAIKRRLARIIHTMTLIRTRRYAEPGTSPSDLAAVAAREALGRAGVAAADVDTLIFAGTDIDMVEPATANILQKKLGLRIANSFDVSNACNSFLQAMNVANSLIATGAARRVLVAAGEVGSFWVNRTVESMDDLAVKIGGLTLGDAGAAIVMERASGGAAGGNGTGGGRGAGILEVNLLTLGEHWELCRGPERLGWRSPGDGRLHGWFYLDMPGLAKVARSASVEYFRGYARYREAVHGERHIQESLEQVIPHQISRRFIEEIVRTVHADLNGVAITADVYGNTASTAIPLALRTLYERGTLSPGSGQEVMLYGAASGFGLGHIRLRL